MYVQFDKNKMHIQIICGTLECYTPSEEMKALQEKLSNLKQKLSDFQETMVFPELKEIEEQINKFNTQQPTKSEE